MVRCGNSSSRGRRVRYHDTYTKDYASESFQPDGGHRSDRPPVRIRAPLTRPSFVRSPFQPPLYAFPSRDPNVDGDRTVSDEYYTKADLDDEVDVTESEFDREPDEDVIDETVSNVEERNIDVQRFESSDDAREHLEDQISDGETVMDGHSTTLEELGFTDVLETADGFEYLGNRIGRIDDDEERFEARRQSVTADVYFDSVNAIAKSGELLGANALGNAVGAWPFGAKRLVLVGSTNKVMPSREAAQARVREFALPLEDARAEKVYGQGSTVGKLVSIERERVDDRTQLVLLEERHGF